MLKVPTVAQQTVVEDIPLLAGTSLRPELRPSRSGEAQQKRKYKCLDIILRVN